MVVHNATRHNTARHGRFQPIPLIIDYHGYSQTVRALSYKTYGAVDYDASPVARILATWQIARLVLSHRARARLSRTNIHTGSFSWLTFVHHTNGVRIRQRDSQKRAGGRPLQTPITLQSFGKFVMCVVCACAYVCVCVCAPDVAKRSR